MILPLPVKATLAVEGGEKLKSWSSFKRLVEALLRARINRTDTIVAIGGGSVGDCVGFAASVVKRGVSWVNIPTTLLAQVDSSIGGKTAINSRYGKNLIGSFYPADQTLICPELLTSLDQRQCRSGLAEIIKIALIADPDFFTELHNHSLKTVMSSKLIQRAIELKIKVIGDDLSESLTGSRQNLNLGHTYGHAFERLDTTLLHGEAVALGLMAESKLAEFMGIAQGVSDKISVLLKRYGLPHHFSRHWPRQFSKLMGYLRQDKKNQNDIIQFILLKDIARLEKQGVDDGILKEFYVKTRAQ